MAIHTTKGSATTLTEGYVYLTDCPVESISSSAPEIPANYTVVEIEGTVWDFIHTNEMTNHAMPKTTWSSDTINWLINLKRIKQVINLRGTIASDSTDTAQAKKNNIRYLIGSLLNYESGFVSGDNRGGTFTIVRKRTIPTPSGTSTFREKFRVACQKCSIREIGEKLDKFEVVMQLLEGKDKLQG